MNLIIRFLIVLIIGVPQLAAMPAARERCFDGVGYCVSDPILRYWERNGGLMTFGYPISGVRVETAEGRTMRVQWFERDRLEIQADGMITAGRLGARRLELQGRPWETFAPVPWAEPGCEYFPVTQHQICQPFLRYWKTQGGLERFGYPITERFNEPVEGQTYAVQYFERRRMEYHPELAGTRYEILLGRLGADLFETDSCIALGERDEPTAYAYRGVLGCPLAPSRELVGNDRIGLRDVPIAVQPFEHGTMLWLEEFAGDARSPGRIYVLTPDASGQRLTWQRFDDPWREGQPTGVSGTPPAGRYAPQRGFGYLWAHNPEVRARLGWALEPERGETGGYRAFGNGFMLYRPSVDRYYLITSDGRAYDVPRV